VLVLTVKESALLGDLRKRSNRDHGGELVVDYHSACELVIAQTAFEQQQLMPLATKQCMRYSHSRHARLEVGHGQQVQIAAMRRSMNIQEQPALQ
jgi:hypothetical protein